MKTTADTININLVVPTKIAMEINTVIEGHIDGNLCVLKNKLYEISFKDKSRHWKAGDQVTITIPKKIKSLLQLPIEIEEREVEK